MVALEGNPAPGTPPLTGWAASGGALGIWALSGGTFCGAWMMLGLPRLARATVDVGQPLGRRQALPLHQGRRGDLSQTGVPGQHRLGRHHVVDPGEIVGVIDDGSVDHRLVDPGHPGDVAHRWPIAIGASETPAEIGMGVITRRIIAADEDRLGEENRHVGRRRHTAATAVGIDRGVRLAYAQQEAGRPDEDPER